MNTNTPRQPWQTPQVFVLGAEQTQSTKAAGNYEGVTHVDPITVHLTGTTNGKLGGTASYKVGYDSGA